MPSSEEYDTIVIGGGVSGLYAGYLLQETHKQNVLVLEAKDRIGGRLFAADIECASGTDRWDLGGQWVGRSQFHVLKALSDFNLESYEQYATGKRKMVRCQDISDLKSNSASNVSFGPLEYLEMYLLIKKLDKLCATIDPENVANHPNAVEWDSMSLHTFMTKHCRFLATKEVLEAFCRAASGTDLAGITVLNFLLECKLAGGSLEAALGSGDDGAQELRVKGTLFSLCEKLSEKLENIVVGEPVVRIDQTDEEEVVRIATKSGKEFRCKHVIVTAPPHLVNHIEFVPELPIDRIRLGESMVPANCIKFIATYENAFWREKGMSGEILCLSPPCSIGPVTAAMDATTSNGNPAIVGFICAEHTLYWTEKSMEERKEAVLQTLSATLGDEALDAITYIDKDWSKERYNGGCPGSITKPRTIIYYHHALRQQYGRVHWAGTETARIWSGYVDGALESSLRSVSEVVAGETPPLSHWKSSPAFSNFRKFNSKIQKKSLVWPVVKLLIVLAVIGFMCYLIAVTDWQ